VDKTIANDILTWYQQNKRDLPWRHTKDPYAIIVSEMMLQQTQVKTVIDYYTKFLARFESFFALADASEAEVLNCWQGLGYYSRARNLHKLSKIVASEYNGKLPDHFDDLKNLPGIGDYMVGAVLSIAYNQPVPAVDGNVLRVVARISGIKDDITKQAIKKKVSDLVKPVIPIGHAADFTQSMMEMGALICRPHAPACHNCPVSHHCYAYKNQQTDLLPVKTKKSKPKQVMLWACVIHTHDAILLEYRDQKGLLANMWGVPVLPRTQKDDLAMKIKESLLNVDVNTGFLGEVSHVFTHRHWKIIVAACRIESEVKTDPRFKWVKINEIDILPIPVVFQKCLKLWDSKTIISDK
jgi:A/G-specific adenine glycosylase